ncbi:MAG TPA: questin oxidase family protein [Acidimicrobiales bacterium]
METDRLDDALSTFAATAPEFGTFGLSNHGPMASEVLEHLGRDDAIGGWAADYARRLDEGPSPALRPLAEDDWPHALGDGARYPEWLGHFERELADRPVRAVVGEWVPRLAPGTIGAAAHGLIRTAHGLRALAAAETDARRLELAQGLAYWASSYQELPGPPLLIGAEGVEQALADLPYLPEEAPEAFLISDRVAYVAEISDEFEQAVASLGFTGSSLDLLDALASGGARAYLRNADRGSAIALLHAITGPLALEMVLPWLAAEDHDAALAYAWQAVASIHVAYAIDRHPPELEDVDPPDRDELVDRAIASGDEHALKLTEAALRSHARSGDPYVLWAAADACARL